MTERFRMPAGRRPLRVLVVGSVSRDLDRLRPDAPPIPGGVVTHAGLAHAGLGAEVRVVTSVRRADARALLAPLRAAAVGVRARPSRGTTTCVNAYGGAVDLHEVRVRSDAIRLADVPRAWRESDVVQLGPLHPRDVLPEVVGSGGALRGLDVQGLLRGPRRAVPAEWLAVLAACHVVQVSQSDAARLFAGDSPERWRRRTGVRELILTRGARGAVVVTERGRVPVAPRRVDVRHPTGAGDVFLAAYLQGRARGLSPARAGRLAARAAALHVGRGRVSRVVWRGVLG
jgi:sugar/nucleoside kinase (ribokinase family)